MCPFWILLELRMMVVVVTTGVIRRQNVTTNKPTSIFLKARCPRLPLPVVNAMKGNITQFFRQLRFYVSVCLNYWHIKSQWSKKQWIIAESWLSIHHEIRYPQYACSGCIKELFIQHQALCKTAEPQQFCYLPFIAICNLIQSDIELQCISD